MTPIFQDEVQLAGWSDSHTSGAKVTFWLNDPALLDAFRGMTERKGKTAGQRLAMVLVEINDQEEPTQQPKEPIGELCKLAVMWCKDPKFQEWLIGKDVLEKNPGIDAEQTAKRRILHQCGVESRKELDTSAVAATKFHMGVRTPYMEYLKGLG